MKLKYTYLFFIGLVLLSSFSIVQKTETSSVIELLTSATNFEAGNDIVLKFSTSNSAQPFLYCTNSYGTTLVKPRLKNNILSYKLPKIICKKRGIIHWKLNKTSLIGKLTIHPIQKVATMETYIGPPSIEAGRKDYSMHIIIPTDSLDNPLAEKTLVTTKHQFLRQEKKDAIYIKNLIAYKNLYSPLKSGRILASSECLAENSKEFTIIVYPTNPTNFTISAARHHSYADGNQITTFYSSIIKDAYNNIVSDGTFVNFFIKNKKGNTLKTSGTTIKGIAAAKMIHPDYKTTWSIKAYVEGMAESNTISVNYQQVLNDFKVDFSKNNRIITIGPLQSFMQQMIPDGLVVRLFVYKNNVLINSEIKTSYNGFVNFNLNTAVYKKRSYTIKITTAGLEKEFKTITLW
ncbi:hypothetical protein CXF68_13025 [Tenacibaculum sp. Bg11-29]|uniref:hypothetical protein n=1 Tax=Tenacibaculum sp. Bg11-29 TaxID=2058306 RepID=UPI000C3320B5|nr:hypothetical protein [Tenacibaculum sp. Bg11-29]PKH51548.1 hypothetical protein CXF68_13025 [Tenacibaculum sp. Bg11-29]